MPIKPYPNPADRSLAEAASYALRAALAERLAGRMSPYRRTGSAAAGLTLGALPAGPDTAPRKLHSAA